MNEKKMTPLLGINDSGLSLQYDGLAKWMAETFLNVSATHRGDL
jgi:hypothetical protein